MSSLSQRLQEFREHLARISANSKASSGWTYDEEIADLDEAIALLKEMGH